MSKLTREWSAFNHEEGYEKAMQDVKLKSGNIYYGSWPNAGYWNVCYPQQDKRYNNAVLDVRDTVEVRLHESEIIL